MSPDLEILNVGVYGGVMKSRQLEGQEVVGLVTPKETRRNFHSIWRPASSWPKRSVRSHQKNWPAFEWIYFCADEYVLHGQMFSHLQHFNTSK